MVRLLLSHSKRSNVAFADISNAVRLLLLHINPARFTVPTAVSTILPEPSGVRVVLVPLFNDIPLASSIVPPPAQVARILTVGAVVCIVTRVCAFIPALNPNSNVRATRMVLK